MQSRYLREIPPLLSGSMGGVTGVFRVALPVAHAERQGERGIYIAPVLHDRLSGRYSGEAAARAIRTLRPRQVMLEIDSERFKKTLEALKLNRTLPQASRADVVATVHGGLMTRELKEAVGAAKAVDAAIYLIDRPFGITQNRVASKVLNPVVFSHFLQYAAKSLRDCSSSSSSSGGGGEEETVKALNATLQESCPSIHRVLIEERNEFMATQILAQAVQDEDVLVVCGAAQAAGLAELLCDPKKVELIDLAEISRKGISLWPLVLTLYFVLPVFLALQVWLGSVAWLNRRLMRLFGVSTTAPHREAPQLEPSVKSI